MSTHDWISRGRGAVVWPPCRPLSVKPTASTTTEPKPMTLKAGSIRARVLLCVHDGLAQGITPRLLADGLDIEPRQLTDALRKLDDRGFVSGRIISEVSMTAKGMAEVRRLRGGR